MLNRLLLPILLVLSACATVPVEPPRPTAVVESGIVSAADPRAAEAGIAILREGGSAADAALAVLLALTVVEPQSSGIGGGGFLVYHDEPAGKVATYDGRETAPAAATPAWFLGPDGEPMPRGVAIPSGKSVGVPGNIRLMEIAHERHGRLEWARLFEPAIALARNGFAITPRLHNFLGREGAGASAWGRAQFYLPDGTPKPVGTIVRNPELADLLERVARLGPDYFYTGAPAEAIVRTVRTAPRNPAPITMGDLATYESKERDPVCGEYRGHRICSAGPPSSGGIAVISILKQLERFDLAALGPESPEAWHLIGDSMRLAYADREAYVADPEYVPVPTAGLTDPDYLARRSALLMPGRAIPHVTHGVPPGAQPVLPVPTDEVPSTSHFVVVDSQGNVASLTSTIEGPWGSGLTVDGYYLNNELTDFTFVPVENGALVVNRVEGGKRPRSSMSPTIVYGPDGEVRIAIGASGGMTIIAQVAKALIAMIDWNMGPQEAIAAPVMMGLGDRLLIERGSALEAMIPALEAMGHTVVTAEPTYKANAAQRIDGRWVGGADPRSEGVALRVQPD